MFDELKSITNVFYKKDKYIWNWNNSTRQTVLAFHFLLFEAKVVFFFLMWLFDLLPQTLTGP